MGPELLSKSNNLSFMEQKSKRVEFTPPKQFAAPEGSGTEKEFDLVCSFRMKSSGELCMTRLGDLAMPGYDEEHDEHDEDRESEHKPGYDRMSNQLMADMGAGGMGNTTGMAGGY